MNIENRVRKRIAHLGAEPAHEAGQTDQSDMTLAKRADERAIVGFPCGVFLMRQDTALDSRPASPVHPLRSLTIGNDDDDPSTETARPLGVNERLKVRASPVERHAD